MALNRAKRPKMDWLSMQFMYRQQVACYVNPRVQIDHNLVITR